MEIYKHQTSEGILCGMPLVGGATVRKGDYYDSPDGSWKPAYKKLLGMTVEPYGQVTFIRPRELSRQENFLLLFLHFSGRSLVNLVPGGQTWLTTLLPLGGKVHPVPNHHCVETLFDLGFIAPPKEYPTNEKGVRVYSLTKSGRQKALLVLDGR